MVPTEGSEGGNTGENSEGSEDACTQEDCGASGGEVLEVQEVEAQKIYVGKITVMMNL